MSSTFTPNDGEISGAVMFYSRPEALSPELHGDLGLVSSAQPFAFARHANAVPLHVTEFGLAAVNYPIVFAGDEKTPLAIMSIQPNANLFIEKGRFESDVYIPAFIRRYPFVVANDQTNSQLVVCIDRGAEFIKVGGETRLFENGEPTQFTKNCIQFCTDFETERQRTVSFVDTLKRLDLLESRDQFYTPRNADGSLAQPVKLTDYFAVSEDRLKALTPEQLAELRDSGALQQIYAHMNSLFAWDKLVARTLALPPQAANA